MKQYIVQLFATLTVCLAVFTSCITDAEGTLYHENGVGAAFASTKMNLELTADDKGVIKVPVYRANTQGEASVNIDIDGKTVEAGIFSLKNPKVAFNNGEAVTYAEVNFASIDDLGATSKYEITLTLTNEEQLSPSKVNTITVVVGRKLTWKNIGVGVYTSEIFGDSWDQPVEKAEEGNVYRLPDCIFEGYPIIFSLSDDGQSLAGWDKQAIGYVHPTYGMMSFKAVEMERVGNTLSFHVFGLVDLGTLAEGIEVLELPE